MPKAGKAMVPGKPELSTRSLGDPAIRHTTTRDNKSAEPMHPLSLSEEILRRVSKPVAPQSPQTPTPGSSSPTITKAGSSQKRPKKRSRDDAADNDAPSPKRANNDQQSKVELNHASFWQQCVPAAPAVYSSIIVDIEWQRDEKTPRTPTKPMVFRRLCFLTKIKAPIESTDPFPVAKVLCSVSRFGFKSRSGPAVDLTDSRRFSNARDYTRKLMAIMARLPALQIAESDMPYLLMPLKHGLAENDDMLDEQSIIDWGEVNAFATGHGRMLERDEVVDANRLKHIVDDGLFSYHPTDVSARFEVVALRKDLQHSSLVEGPSGEESILALQPRKWREALEQHQGEIWDTQPIFELETAWDLHTMLRPAGSLRTRCELTVICSSPHPGSSDRQCNC
jgi:hypothetical protein